MYSRNDVLTTLMAAESFHLREAAKYSAALLAIREDVGETVSVPVGRLSNRERMEAHFAQSNGTPQTAGAIGRKLHMTNNNLGPLLSKAVQQGKIRRVAVGLYQKA
jgi:hypothetical protein